MNPGDGGYSPKTKLLNEQAARNNKFLALEKKLSKMGQINTTTRNDIQKLKVSNSLPSESFVGLNSGVRDIDDKSMSRYE
jgi:hypothetical protein